MNQKKTVPLLFLRYLCFLLTDFNNSFTISFIATIRNDRRNISIKTHFTSDIVDSILMSFRDVNEVVENS